MKFISLVCLIISTILPKNIFYSNKDYQIRKTLKSDYVGEYEFENTLIVVFNQEVSGDTELIHNILNSVSNNGFSLISSGYNDIYMVDTKDVDYTLRKYKSYDEILSVTCDSYCNFSTFNEDFDNMTRSTDYDYALGYIDINDAWAYTMGSSEVKVGIIDSGIDYYHPDLVGKVSTTLSASFIEGVETYGIIPTDIRGHGTAVAGFIGANHNDIGIDGVCKNITLVSLQLDTFKPRASDAIRAISYAEDVGIKILNLSISWDSYDNFYDGNLSAAINNYNGIVICAAGNDGRNVDESSITYPAIFTCDNLIVVGASNSNNMRWVRNNTKSSNYGSTSVDLFAPGADLYHLNVKTADVYPNTTIDSGTSYAAPFVTGVAALLMSYRTNISINKIKECILYGVEEIPVLSGLCVTGGLLNAHNALSLAYHTHSYSYSNINAIYHKKSCTGCHYSIDEEHIWTSTSLLELNQTEPNYIPGGYRCNLCGAVRKDIL